MLLWSLNYFSVCEQIEYPIKRRSLFADELVYPYKQNKSRCEQQ